MTASKVAVVGLGYVGLPLAVAFGRLVKTVGIDLSQARIGSFQHGIDPMGEMPGEKLRAAIHLEFTTDPAQIAGADFIVVAVPTPLKGAHQPDFDLLVTASRMIGANMSRGATVIFESTVYPGATEEICIPELEQASGMKWMTDFHVAYSPERVNPGDTERTLEKIVKVVSGDDAATLERVADLYGQVIEAGVYRVSSIKVAEAAKVIENTQRDLNIALMNELAIIFDKMDIDTLEVLEAAGTKWNFLPFRPGLVGGHCIGVDPYYLTHKAEMMGYISQVILAGRRINDGMGQYVAERTVKLMARHGCNISGATINLLGLTFKENCTDLRNSRVIDVISELREFGIKVNVHDPLADPQAAAEEYGVELVAWDDLPRADAVILAVGHAAYLEKSAGDFMSVIRDGGCFVDVKASLDVAELERLGLKVWRL